MTVVAIIQARMGSTRFPGKMLMKISDKPLIWHVIHRVKQATLVDNVVVATSVNKNNGPLVKEIQKYGVDCFVGDENDVLDRFYQCAKKFKAKTIVRITGDCPFIDPKIIDDVIQLFKKNKLDYASNVHPPTFPDGLDVEVFSFAALKKAWKEATLQSEREHVTPYIWKNEHIFKKMNLKNKEDFSSIRLAVDEEKDLEFVRKIFKRLYTKQKIFYMEDILILLQKHPQLQDINAGIQRNEGYLRSLKQDKKSRR